MKKSIIYFLVFSLFSCTQKEEKFNKIKIEISGLGNDITYVLNKKDSIFKSKNEIVFTVPKINEPKEYSLQIFRDSLKKPIEFFSFWYENKDVKIVGKWDEKEKYITPLNIYGGDLQDISSKFNAVFGMYENVTLKLFKSGKSKKEIDIAFSKIKDSIYSGIIKLAFTKPNNRISLKYVTKTVTSKISQDSLELYYTKLDESLKKSKNGVSLKEIINTTKLKIGDAVKDFTAIDVNGKEVHLFDFKGKIILLDFWASWCKPCHQQNKEEFVDLYKRFKDKGLVMISFSVDKKNKEKAWKLASKKDSITWVSVSNLKGSASNPITYQYGVKSFPHSFLINKEGVIVNSFLDYNKGQHKIEKAIVKLLNKK